jgi:hypothetical protein
MGNSYYFLVAGLPDILLDNTKKAVSFTQFVDDISEQVNPADTSLLKILRFSFDNYNLINLLEKRAKEFDDRGYFTKDELEQEIKLPELTPGYMQLFLENYKEDKMAFPELSIDDQLNWLFYEEMTTHSNEFIRDWFSFDLDLRNIIAGFNCRQIMDEKNNNSNNISISNSVICQNDVSELILKSNAPDFSLSNRFPWIEKLESIKEGNLIDYEKNIDTIKWETLNELITFSYFQIETVLAYCIKVEIVERWQAMEAEAGRQKLELLLTELNSGFNIPEYFK